MIGQPFMNPLPWDASAIKVQVEGQSAQALGDSPLVAQDFVWGWRQNDANPYTGSYYLIADPAIRSGDASELEPWEAYWFFAYRECDLILPPP